MKLGPDISSTAALIGDPARANILTALISGCALTATELASEAGVTKQTTSSHLAKLVDGGFLSVEKQGRHKYYRLANHEIAALLESLANVAADIAPKRVRTGPKEPALRKARRCYDHLAGEIAVKMFDGFIAQGLIVNDRNNNQGFPILTTKGTEFFDRFGIDIKNLNKQKRPICRSCLDWSVRRHHLAGGLGAALLSEFESRGWAKRSAKNRIIEFSQTGEQKLLAAFLL
ncbi:MAG: winged helix-turn-helix transcriptional regulator [Alphaproteobacteria bacterium]|nr:winged helix-turn-helix transcriptional regulator [Alphaproteobacteria bacterium]